MWVRPLARTVERSSTELFRPGQPLLRLRSIPHGTIRPELSPRTSHLLPARTKRRHSRRARNPVHQHLGLRRNLGRQTSSEWPLLFHIGKIPTPKSNASAGSSPTCASGSSRRTALEVLVRGRVDIYEQRSGVPVCRSKISSRRAMARCNSPSNSCARGCEQKACSMTPASVPFPASRSASGSSHHPKAQ